MEFLEQTYYGNTLLKWISAVFLVFGCIIASRILFWISARILKRLALSTPTRIDDLFLDIIEQPLIFALTIFGIWHSLDFLQFDHKVQKTIADIYFFLIIFNVAWFVNRLFEALAHEYIAPIVMRSTTDMDDMILPILRQFVKMGIWIIAIIIAISNAGYDVGALVAGLGIGGLAVALAAQETISNLIGGITIIADQPFVIKDWIRIGNQIGQIKQIGLRSTQIETIFGTKLIIPNSKLINEKLENLTKSQGRRIELNIPLDYHSTPDQVELAMQLLKKIVLEHQKTLDDVSVLFRNFDNFAMNLRIRYFIRLGESSSSVRSDLNLQIQREFAENGLKLAEPIKAFFPNANGGGDSNDY